ncbi:MAG: MBL fold metallo-hydrolase [Bacteroidota bacterium]
MKIIPLLEGIFTVTKDKIFTPITREEVNTTAPGLLTMGICPFLIVLQDDLILLDAGLGFTTNGKATIVQLIEAAGYTAHDVTRVLLSHLHKDHSGGLGTITEDGFTPNFANAQVYLQENELKYALDQISSHSFDQNILEHIAAMPNLVFMDEKGTIGDFITYEVTGGHTPFHQVFWITEEQQTAFYGADNLPQKSYLKFHIAYKSDFDGKKAMEDRQNWEQQAKVENWTVLFYHDISKNAAKL